MKVYKNERLISRNARIGQYTSIGALLILGAGMYISFQRQDLFLWSVAALVVGFTMTQIGMSYTNRWGRKPRPDEQIDAALKGLPSDLAIYHYMSPVPHLLVGPAGMWILQAYHQRGKITYARNRWRLTGGGFMQGYMSIFGQEGLGRPEIDVAAETGSLRRYLAKHVEDSQIPEIQSALVFTNDQIEIDAPDAPIPAMKLKQIKEFFRQKSKERSLGSVQLEALNSALAADQEPS